MEMFYVMGILMKITASFKQPQPSNCITVFVSTWSCMYENVEPRCNQEFTLKYKSSVDTFCTILVIVLG